MPQVVISDRGPQFVSQFMRELYRMLDITPNASTRLPPTDRQTNGTSKSRGREVPPNLSQSPTDRLERLAPLAEFAHNNCIHSTTKKSPSWCCMAETRESFLTLHERPHSQILPAADFTKTMTTIHKETEKALNEAAGRMKAQYDKRKCPARISKSENAYGSTRTT